ncbi:hypothetical protein GCM10007103_35100 [Salinimicrobium marinum]|uniref:PDZ domain-containing protein n=1 Tax=Salinimicrobium marinum TaxID=680283 RepID=A0A918W324_9FLAO|nr:aspartyl protease family protein [Salinimicrobium marinum]GHA51619.1 hypothetical protein GCM10007103_35100 [Salinimicrobium marinum]
MKYILLILAVLIFSGCGGSKANEYLKQGNTVQKDYKTTIPFEMRKGFMIVKVNIGNEVYDFLLDTGSSTILSKELADKIGMTPLGSENVGDIFDEEKRLQYGKIENIKIGNIDFQNTVGAVLDFEGTVLSCLNIDGLLGSNLMRHAVWDFNFENQTITFTNNEDSLDIPNNNKGKKMYVGFAGIPSITIKVNNKNVLNNTVDFGFTGEITLRSKEFEKQKRSERITQYAEGYGKVLEGAYGQGKSSTFYTSKIEKIKIGDIVLNDRIVRTYAGVHNGLGLGFFKDYRVIMNWGDNRIKLIEKSQHEYEGYQTYGFNWMVKDNAIYISALIKNTSASQNLELDDRVIAINGTDYSEGTEIKKCDFIGKGLTDNSNDEISITVLRKNKRHTFNLKKTEFFPLLDESTTTL